MKPAAWRFARVCAWTCQNSSNQVGARAATTQTPRRPTGRWRGRGAKPSGSLSVTTTHALFAGKVQGKLSNGVDRASIRSETGIRPELRLRNVAAQTRIVSVARIRLDSWKSVRPFKGIFYNDISEFESYMPSQPVSVSSPDT